MTDNILHNIIELGLPYVIAALEFMGIFVVSWSGIMSFVGYIQNSFFGKKLDIKFDIYRIKSSVKSYGLYCNICPCDTSIFYAYT